MTDSIKKTMDNLEKNGIKAFFVETKEEVVPLVKTLVPQGSSVSNGGSVSLAETGGGGAVELLAEFGRGYRNKQLGSLGVVAASQIHGSVLGYYPLSLESGGDHTGTRGQMGLDFVVALVGLCQHGQERNTALRTRRAVHKVVLAADTAEYALANGVGAYLTGKVYFKTRVD